MPISNYIKQAAIAQAIMSDLQKSLTKYIGESKVMGYTHYWKAEGKVSEVEYAKAFKDCVKIVKTVTERTKIGNTIDFPYIPLGDAMGDDNTKPEINKLGLTFNGIGNDAHETFSIPSSAKELEEFQFCKTAQKPYDAVVVACLARLAKVKNINVSSDGDSSDWVNGIKLAEKILGGKFEYPADQ